MQTLGEQISFVTETLVEKTGIKWNAQLTSKGFILHRKGSREDYDMQEYNAWRDVCCEAFNVGYDTLDNDLRAGLATSPRHWCWYMMTSVSMINVDSIVKLLNGAKDRTSILHAIRKVHNYIYRKRPDRASVELRDKLLAAYLEFKTKQ